MRITRPSALCGALALTASAAALAAVPAIGQEPVPPAAPTQLLPDLQQEVPSQLSVIKSNTSRKSPRYQLGFRSSAYNVGPGVLVVHGRRPSTKQKHLTGDQIINMSDGTTQTKANAGRLLYNQFPDHSHWHFVGFERYELRNARNTLVRRDRKSATGFCLGDRYLVAPEPQQPPRPQFDGQCGRGKRNILSLYTGISINWADDYAPHLEGQSIDVTGLRAGTYQLVHRANPSRGLSEANYANNASSLRVRLTWPNGRKRAPKVTTVKECPGTARCR